MAITELLYKGVMVRLESGSIEMCFEYLELLNFYYGCGWLDYVLKACNFVDPSTLKSGLQYSAWLQACPLSAIKRM